MAQERNASLFFRKTGWPQWSCLSFLKFIRNSTPVYLEDKAALHGLFIKNLNAIQASNPDRFIANHVQYLLTSDLKVITDYLVENYLYTENLYKFYFRTIMRRLKNSGIRSSTSAYVYMCFR